MERTRRSLLLQAGPAAVALLAGCSSAPPSDDENETDTDDTETANTDSTETDDRCPFYHEIISETDQPIEAEYEYQNLSSAAKKAVDPALKTGSSELKRTPENNPPEFEYSDVMTYYKIKKDGEEYILATNSGVGCQR